MRTMHTFASGQILLTLARALMIGLPALLGELVVAFQRRILDHLPGGVLVPVAGMLHQLAFSLLESFGLPLPSLGQRPVGLAGSALHRRGLGTRAPADGSGLGRSPVGLLFSSVWPWHQAGTTRANTSETARRASREHTPEGTRGASDAAD